MIGAFIAFGQNYGKPTSGTIDNSTYWGQCQTCCHGVMLTPYTAFIAIMLVGSVLSWCLVSPWKVYRSDGSRAGHDPKLNVVAVNETLAQKFVRVAKREVLSILAIRHEKRRVPNPTGWQSY